MRKETVDIDILVTSRNGDRKIMQSIRIMIRPTLRTNKQAIYIYIFFFWSTYYTILKYLQDSSHNGEK